MKLLCTTASILLAAAVSAPALDAQEAAWNRRISDVRIVHPPGTPPGTWRAVASVTVEVTEQAPVASLGFELHLLLNGVDIGVVPSGPLDHQNGPSCAVAGGGCLISTCNFLNNGGGDVPGVCGQFPSPLTGVALCGCITAVGTYDWGTSTQRLYTTDVLSVQLIPTPTSLPDPDVSDDTFSLTVPDNVIGTPYCSGDVSNPIGCPCANTGAAGHGCANSANPSGALLEATGWTQYDPITGTDSVVLHGSGMPATSTAIYLKGSDTNLGAVFGDGLLCVDGALIRLRKKINVGGQSRFPEPGDPSLSVRGGTPEGSGLVARYQVYYRNAAAAFCPPATFNVSNGIAIDW
jgi:hypothetical protein